MPTKPIDTSGWLTKQQAADAIGVSTKTVEQLALRKEIEQGKRIRPGRPAIAVYNPQDVERVSKERNPDAVPFVLPPAAPGEAVSTEIARTSQNFPNLLEAALLQAVQRPAAPRLFMGVDEASEYSGLPKSYLKELIREGKIGLKTGAGWRIRRADLEAL